MAHRWRQTWWRSSNYSRGGGATRSLALAGDHHLQQKLNCHYKVSSRQCLFCRCLFSWALSASARSATGAVACFSPPHGSSLLLIVWKSKTKYFSIVSIHSSHKWPIFSKLVEALGGGIWTAVVGDWDRSVIFCLFRMLILEFTRWRFCKRQIQI